MTTLVSHSRDLHAGWPCTHNDDLFLPLNGGPGRVVGQGLVTDLGILDAPQCFGLTNPADAPFVIFDAVADIGHPAFPGLFDHVGVTDQGPHISHHIRLPILNELIGLAWKTDLMAGHHGNADPVFDLFCHIDAKTEGDVHGRHNQVEVVIGTYGNVDEIYGTGGLQCLGHRNGFLRCYAAPKFFIRAQTDADGEITPHGRSNALYNLKRKPHAVRQIAAVLICALV